MGLNVLVGAVMVGLALIAIVAYMVVTSRMPDDRNEALAATPGYELAPPGADRLWDFETTSVAQVGATRTQIWGITGTEVEYIEYLDSTLGALGWELVQGPVPEMRDGARLLREYRLGDSWLTASRVDQPHRLPGSAKTPRRNYTFLSYTRISNMKE